MSESSTWLLKANQVTKEGEWERMRVSYGKLLGNSDCRWTFVLRGRHRERFFFSQMEILLSK